MDRIITILMLALGTLCLALTGKNYLDNPQKARMDALAKRLNTIEPRRIDYITQSNVDYTSLQGQILSRPNLFQELIPPSPPPKVAPPPPPKPPDLEALLKGVIASRNELTRGGVKKVRMTTPASKTPEFFKVGDQINGVTLKEIKRTEVIFSIIANEVEYTKAIPRQ
ncbi:MAG: hypothetical protein AAB353_02565 [Candidatus Hydrogenedentota bacterium]